jgi:hypothetical protein
LRLLDANDAAGTAPKTGMRTLEMECRGQLWHHEAGNTSR